MRKSKWYTRITAFVLCLLMLLSGSLQAQAKTSTVKKEDAYRLVFDADYYYERYTDLQTAIGKDPEKLFAHFVNNGIYEGRNGCEDFNLRAYIQANPDLMEAFGEDFGAYCRHFIDFGRQEGRTSLPQEDGSKVLGSYTSEYDVAEQRAVNVELAAARINGVVLQPGEKFSFSKTVLPRTSANGYVPGPVFVSGRKVIGMGGGICQVSSTLYVAMVRAVLPSTEHWNHSGEVDYVPAGLDATIAGNAKDLKFVNVYSRPLLITATTEDGVLTVSLSFAEDH